MAAESKGYEQEFRPLRGAPHLKWDSEDAGQ